jgi:cytochrome P450
MAFIPHGAVWRRSRRELQASLRPADLESYQPIEQRAVHCLLRNLLSSPDNFEQHSGSESRNPDVELIR